MRSQKYEDHRVPGAPTAPRFAAAVLLFVSLSISTGIPMPSAAESSESLAAPTTGHAVTVHGADAVLISRLSWALDRFSAADLELPELDISFHTTRSRCSGREGLHWQLDGVSYIEACDPTRELLLHELAHAWTSTHLTDDARASYVDWWALESWNDHDHAWEDRGTERAAVTLAFALADPLKVPSGSVQQHLDSYPTLVGRALPSTTAVACGSAVA